MSWDAELQRMKGMGWPMLLRKCLNTHVLVSVLAAYAATDFHCALITLFRNFSVNTLPPTSVRLLYLPPTFTNSLFWPANNPT